MIKTKYHFTFYSLAKNILLILSDCLAVCTSLFLSLSLRKVLPQFFPVIEFPDFFKNQYYNAEMLTLFFILFVVFAWNSLYQKRRTFWDELLLIWQSLAVSCLILYLLLFNFENMLPFMSRIVVIFIFVFLMFSIPLYRYILKWTLYRLSLWRTPMIVACKKDEYERAYKISKTFEKDFYLGFVPIAFFIEGGENLTSELPIYTRKEDLPRPAVVCLLDSLADSPLFIYFYNHYGKIYLIPNEQPNGFRGLDGQYLFTERLFIIKVENRLNSHLAQFIKNTMDRVLGFLITMALSPIFLVIALIIKLKSPGPVLYSQSRIGKNGKEFRIWKFRTMYQDADQKLQDLLASDVELKKEWDTYFKLKDDPRITPIGHFLRKYSLDEFPQLINVLTGEMSLIGPRPFVKNEIDEEYLPIYAQVKPGLTGLWQVSGRNQIDRMERLNIDMWYINHWSLSLDLLILLNTPLAVLSGRGAS